MQRRGGDEEEEAGGSRPSGSAPPPKSQWAEPATQQLQRTTDAAPEVKQEDDSQPPPDTQSIPHKLFIGGLSWDTTDEGFRAFFRQFGEVLDATVMRDRVTGNSRGFGFVTFKDGSSVDQVMSTTLELDGRRIDPKRAVPRNEDGSAAPSAGGGGGGGGGGGRGGGYGGHGHADHGSGGGGGSYSDPADRLSGLKIFVGGLSLQTTEEDMRAYFDSFGPVDEVVIMTDAATNRSRGFGFVTFRDERAAEVVVQQRLHSLGGRKVECKMATPKSKMPPRDGGRGGPPNPWAAPRGGDPYGYDRGGRGRGGGDYYDRGPPRGYDARDPYYGGYDARGYDARGYDARGYDARGYDRRMYEQAPYDEYYDYRAQRGAYDYYGYPGYDYPYGQPPPQGYAPSAAYAPGDPRAPAAVPLAGGAPSSDATQAAPGQGPPPAAGHAPSGDPHGSAPYQAQQRGSSRAARQYRPY